MKVIILDKTSGETVARIITNHSMTIDEAIRLVGEIYDDENDENVLINGKWYYYENLDMDYTRE